MLELRILGGLRLTEDGSIRRFRAPDKAVELLAYLVLRPGPVDRTSLAELLWPDDPTDEARTKLRRHLYDLTQVLPPDVAWIVGDKRTVAWNREAPCRLDVARFTELAQSDPAAALDCYGGDLLPTIESPWLAGERERLRAQAVRLREELANEALARGAYAEALEHATHLSAADPWNESAVRTHIAARIAVGDATGAAAVYHAFARRLKDDLGVEPAAVTRAAYEAAVAPPRTTRIVGTRLTSFIGRTTDIRAIAALLEHASLVTLVGPGGVGKTRLLEELVRATFAPETTQIAFARLAGIENAESIPGAIAAALGVREEHEVPLVDTLVATFFDRDLVLAVDNCEHVVDAVALLLEEIVRRLPRARVVATSREPLAANGEHVYRVMPLATDESVALFIDRARAAGAMDATDRANPTISAICTKLDGLPLAIELAAAQSYDQRLSALARCLEDDFPTATRRTLDRRQRSIPALLDWSVDRLTPEAQAAFRAVGAISGSFTAQTADAVCGASAPLTALVAKSLVVKDKDRYVLLETTRRHARNLLDAAGDGDAVRTRLVARARAIAGEAQAELPLLRRPAWRARFEPEVELVRGALEWAFKTPAAELDGIVLAAELDTLWWETSRAVEGVRWIERALARLPDDAPKALHARCWLAAAWLRPEGSARIDVAERAFAASADLASDSERARAGCAYAWSAQYLENRRHLMDGVLRDARAQAECANDAYATALAVHLQGDVALRAHRDTEASALYDDALARYRSAADDRGVAMVLANIAEGAFRRGELGDALRFSAESLAIMRSRNERQIALPLIVNIAMYAVAKGDAERARIHADEGFAIASDAGLAMETAMFLPVYASLAAHERDFARAARLVGCTDRLYREGNFLRDHTELVIYETLVERLHAEMSDDDFAREHALGARSTPVEAVRAPRAGTRGRSSATA